MGIPLDYYRNEGSINGLIADGVISDAMLNNTQMINGVECITVHPTFLYELMWNLMLLIFLYIYRKHKKFTGEFALMYVAGYGLGRSIIEGFRTDSLMLGSTGIRISQLVGISCFVIAGAVLIYKYIRLAKENKTVITEENN